MFTRQPSKRLKNFSLFWSTLACLFLGVGSNPEIPPSHQLIAFRGGSVLFTVRIPSGKVVKEVEWNYKAKDSPVLLIGEYRDGKWERPETGDQFEGRLKQVNETTLKIQDLELEDGGIYKAHVRFDTAEIPEYIFNLAVYEPVPTPRILPRLTSLAPGECNLTLQCQVPQTDGLNISWRRGNTLRPLGEDLSGYQLSDDGRDLRLAWRRGPSDATFTCLVSNPVHEKRVSFDLLSICSNKDEGHLRSKWAFAAIIPLHLLLAGIGT